MNIPALRPEIAEAKLCFVRGGYAFFTNALVEEVIGGDWKKRPYYFNASDPHNYVFKVAFLTTLETPENTQREYSAEELNTGIFPWLFAPVHSRETIKIWAGDKFIDFAVAVTKTGGEVFVPINWTK